ncbi:MAG: DUF4337 family protein [Opitutales bacterium]
MTIKLPTDAKTFPTLTLWEKVLNATPIVMTVIATMLAGLASSEMTKAQYDRAFAAQKQSKAGDQWGFFQAKRMRSAIQSGTLDVLENSTTGKSLDAAGLRGFAATLPDAAPVRSALDLLLAGRLPLTAAAPAPDPKVQAVLAAIDQGRADADLDPLLTAATPALVDAALLAAQEHSRNFDARLGPVVKYGDRFGDALDPTGPAPRGLIHDFTVLRLRYSSLRYDAEARLNQTIASLYEVQVRQNNLTAERHHLRSQRFFFGMLAAQAAVIIATFAMAARQRSLLWSLAAAAGLGALSFAAYVFLFI